MNQRAYRAEDDHFIDEVTEAARLEAHAILRARRSRAHRRTGAEREAIARLAQAEGSEDVGRAPQHNA